MWDLTRWQNMNIVFVIFLSLKKKSPHDIKGTGCIKIRPPLVLLSSISKDMPQLRLHVVQPEI